VVVTLEVVLVLVNNGGSCGGENSGQSSFKALCFMPQHSLELINSNQLSEFLCQTHPFH
jgi:hypothetical protein